MFAPCSWLSASYLTQVYFLLLISAVCQGGSFQKLSNFESLAEHRLQLQQDAISRWNTPLPSPAAPGLASRPGPETPAEGPLKYQNVSQACVNEWLKLLPRLETTTGLLILDSFGKPTPGMLVGNTAWLGHFDECMNITDFRYCLVDMGVNVSVTADTQFTLPINWGVCVPEACSEGDVDEGLEFLLDYLNVTWISIDDVVHSAAHCTNKPNTDFDWKFIFTCCLIGLLFMLCIAGTIVDKFLKRQQALALPTQSTGTTSLRVTCNNRDQNLHEGSNFNSSLYNNTTGINNGGVLNETEDPTVYRELSASQEAIHPPSPTTALLGLDRQQDHSKPGCLARFLLCFALSRNLPSLFSTRQPPGGIPCLHGIRVVSIFWVILGHSFSMVLNAGLSENLINFASIMVPTFAFQAVLNATRAVDTFFLLSGLLMTYLMLRKMKDADGKISWCWLYLHRYIRLTPALAMLIMIWMFIFPNMSQGPVWHRTETKLDICRTWWWADLLYVNNFIPPSLRQDLSGINGEGKNAIMSISAGTRIVLECISWGWYLANDMQFFIISPIFIILLYRFPRAGIAAVSVTCLASLIATAVLVGVNGYKPGFGGQDIQFGQGVDMVVPDEEGSAFLPANGYGDVVYSKPYCRIPPYLVGMVLGYFIYRTGPKKLCLHPMLIAAGWAVAGAFGMSVIYGLYDPDGGVASLSPAGNVIYLTFAPLAWSLAVAWVIFACHYGFGGVVNDFLSWDVWVPLGRLTYSTYLLHPVIQSLFGFSSAVPVHWSIITLSMIFTSTLLLAHCCALLMFLLVEIPFVNMEKMLQGAGKGK